MESDLSFIKVHDAIFQDKEIKHKDCAMLICLLKSFCPTENSFFYGTDEYLSKRLRCSQRAIQRHLKEAEKLGYIKRITTISDSKKKERNIYVTFKYITVIKKFLVTNKNIIRYDTAGEGGTSQVANNKKEDKKVYIKYTEEKKIKEYNKNKTQEIIEYLNKKTGKKFKHTTKSYSTLISTGIRKGYTLEDFKKVIDIKCNHWINQKTKNGYECSNFLNPKTLFSQKNFDIYLNESPVENKHSKKKK